MPRGPKGEKRPADVIGAAVKVMRMLRARYPKMSRWRRTGLRPSVGGSVD
jgi:hypothetical protein